MRNWKVKMSLDQNNLKQTSCIKSIATRSSNSRPANHQKEADMLGSKLTLNQIPSKDKLVALKEVRITILAGNELPIPQALEV